jgi:hypothetical protein
MRFYTFTLESFEIITTRSRHDDTDTVTFGLQVGTAQFPVQSLFAGNLNNGNYPIGLHFGPVLITEPTTTALFTFEIYNGGAEGLPVSLAELNLQLQAKLVPLLAATLGEHEVDVPSTDDVDPFDDTSDLSGFILEALVDDIGSFIFPDCDGFVVADGIGARKSLWDSAIDAAGGTVDRQTRTYPGSESPAGCGSNSLYKVTWSVTRAEVHGSLRKFLADYGLTPDPGLRSLTR